MKYYSSLAVAAVSLLAMVFFIAWELRADHPLVDLRVMRNRNFAVGTLLIVGGGVYTLGAVTYATRWPDPFPQVLGFHEVFHLLVVVAAVTQFVAVSLVVM